MPSRKILVVDDDKNLIQILKVRVESAGYEVTTALKEEDALEAVKNQAFDLAIVDLQLERLNGISLMKEFHLVSPDIPVIILTAYGTIESAVEAMKQGAYSYLTKPFNSRDMLFQIEKALETRRLTSEIRRLKDLLEEKYDFANIVAISQKMKEVLEIVSRIAGSDSTVYIQGESGTGKELIAKAIHLASDRRDKPFVALNCAALPESLLESKLFGHEKGAFTGAIQSTKGLFTQAHEGTIFLDEIGDMSPSVQAKLLRVLQERRFYPLGSETVVEVDVRVVVATNKDLEEEVKKGLFRGDLYYRIHVIPIRLPPLRERKEDIPPLVDHFVKRFNRQMKKDIKGLTSEAMKKLLLHDWPGNVRELENTIEYAIAMTRVDMITEDDILQPKAGASEQPLKTLKEAKDAFEKDYLVSLLKFFRGNVSEAADFAGKYRADFYSLLKKHGLNPADYRRTE
ncbi:MAG: two component, sigma54 specific, transcriptional regulator, Fis family [Deltaproteobacteria bacterium]|jgi:two-component system response regulator GlrR|nr:two component, sigma54 specific, transcriptional regulator, Fis family [Deltaproteobacteria bacterium]